MALRPAILALLVVSTVAAGQQPKPDEAKAHLDRGDALYEKGDFDGAIGELRESIRLKPDCAEAHADLGVALRAKGDLDGAITEFREAVRLLPDFVEAQGALKLALLKKSSLDKVAQCREAVRSKPDDPQGHFNLGAALVNNGDVNGAIPDSVRPFGLSRTSPTPIEFSAPCFLSRVTTMGRYRRLGRMFG